MRRGSQGFKERDQNLQKEMEEMETNLQKSMEGMVRNHHLHLHLHPHSHLLLHLPLHKHPHSRKEHGKTPLLYLDINFELHMYNGKVNSEKLDNWVRQFVVYCKIQRLKDDASKLHLASLRLESSALILWEAKTQEDMKKSGKVLSS